MDNFRNFDRRTGFLLPPSVDDWLPEKHLARFVAEVVDGFDLRAMIGAYRGSGSAAHHPRMLLSVLVYGYATGVFSSRKLEEIETRQTRRRESRSQILRSGTATACPASDNVAVSYAPLSREASVRHAASDLSHWNCGYRRLIFTRASSVLNCQSALT